MLRLEVRLATVCRARTQTSLCPHLLFDGAVRGGSGSGSTGDYTWFVSLMRLYEEAVGLAIQVCRHHLSKSLFLSL